MLSSIYAYWLVSERSYDPVDAKIEASNVHLTISKKIAQLKEAKLKIPTHNIDLFSMEGEFLVDVGNVHLVPVEQMNDKSLFNANSDEETHKNNIENSTGRSVEHVITADPLISLSPSVEDTNEVIAV